MTATDHAADEAAIRAIVADVEAGFNADDAELMDRHVAGDATIVTALGRELRGRDEVHAASVAGLAGPLAGQRARYEVTSITFPRPDVPWPTSGPGPSTRTAPTSPSTTPWSPCTC